MKPRIPPSVLERSQTSGPCWMFCLSITFLLIGAPARSQESAPSAESIAQAARNAREQQANSTNHTKTITNDDLGVQDSASIAETDPVVSSSIARRQAPKPRSGECDNPDAERLKTNLLAAQEERDQIRRELFYQPVVISDGDVDLKNFKPSSSGLNVGAAPAPQTQPLAPAQVAEVVLEDRISSLKKALTIACDSPEDAEIQRKLDLAEQELHLLQGAFALDQAAYYSKPNYAEDAAGKLQLDAEQQRIQSLESDIQRLRDELATPNSNQIVK
jgi:hypothetical protein